MDYAEEVKLHLSNYKENVIMIQEKGIWKNNRKEYSHILPEEQGNKNFIQAYRELFLERQKKTPIKYHSDFHHLNSSQSMCINFFFPLIHEKKLALLTDILGFPHEEILYDKAEFEKEGMETEGATSFDFYFETKSGMKFYFEIKYTESEFGKAVHDTKHIEKFASVYKKFLQPLTKEYQSPEVFLYNYQILRNLIHIDENSYVVFIYPEGNKKIKEQAEAAKGKMLIDEFKEHFFPITWEVLFEKVTKTPMDGTLKDQYDEFKKKYFLNKK